MTQTTDRPSGTGSRATAAAPDATGGFTHKQIMTILVGLLLGMFLAALDQTVVSTAIRTIADDLHGYDLQAWATTAFLITSTITTPFYGKLSDMYGRRPFYLFAIAVFVIGSAACAFAQSMYMLAAFRALQGIGAGGLMSLALAIIADIVPPRERARYQGYFMAVFGTSSVLGPVIGGFLSGTSSILGLSGWRWIFFVNVPLGVIAFAVVFKVLHLPARAKREHRIDYPGALALITFLVPLLIVAEQGRTWGWGDTKSLVCYVISAVGFVAFILAERALKDDALLPLRMFKNRTFSVSSVSSVVLGAGMFGGILLLPQYLQIVHGSSPTKAGLQMIPLVLGIMAGSIIAGQTVARIGKYKAFPLVGTVFIVAALLSLSFVVGPDTNYWAMAPLMLLMGLGLGFNFQPVILAVQNAVSPREIGVATSSVTFFRQMGGTLGTAVFLSVLFSALPGRLTSAYANARNTPAFQQAAAAHPDQAKALGSSSGASGDLGDTSFVQKFDQALTAPFKTGFSDTLDMVFIIAAAVVAVGFFVLIFLPQLELRSQSGIQAAGAGPAGGQSADGPALAAEDAAGAAAPTSVGPPVADADRSDAETAPVPAGARHDAAQHDAGQHAQAPGAEGGRHEAAPDQPTGLASVPADHLPDGDGRSHS
jgi:EmrB/QacA subfamily drug resistance transporter